MPLLTLLWKYRRIAAVGLLGAALVLGFLRYGHSRYEAGKAAEAARWEKAQQLATDAHNANLAKVEAVYASKVQSLQKQRDEALARPVTRTIRVPVAAVCAPQGPTDAGVPRANPPAEFVDVDDPGFGPLRQRLIEFASSPVNGSGTDAPVPDSR